MDWQLPGSASPSPKLPESAFKLANFQRMWQVCLRVVVQTISFLRLCWLVIWCYQVMFWVKKNNCYIMYPMCDVRDLYFLFWILGIYTWLCIYLVNLNHLFYLLKATDSEKLNSYQTAKGKGTWYSSWIIDKLTKNVFLISTLFLLYFVNTVIPDIFTDMIFSLISVILKKKIYIMSANRI